MRVAKDTIHLSKLDKTKKPQNTVNFVTLFIPSFINVSFSQQFKQHLRYSFSLPLNNVNQSLARRIGYALILKESFRSIITRIYLRKYIFEINKMMYTPKA